MTARLLSSAEINRLTSSIIGCAISVHRSLGPGMLESTYQLCLAAELRHFGLHVAEQVPVAIRYRHIAVECAYKMDLLVERLVAVELKAVAALDPVHTSQVLTYLRWTGLEIGLLVSFNVNVMAQGGIRRVVLGGRLAKPSAPSAGSEPSASSSTAPPRSSP